MPPHFKVLNSPLSIFFYIYAKNRSKIFVLPFSFSLSPTYSLVSKFLKQKKKKKKKKKKMMSSGSLLLMLLIITVIPTIIYCFFFLITCPANPFGFSRRRSENPEEMDVSSTIKMADHDEEDNKSNKNNMELVVMSSSMGKDVDCPVCLADFVEGEELRQLKICKHLFHKGCIDKWLSTHFNCPVCRAFVSSHLKPKEKEGHVFTSRNVDRHDLWQGLPDSAGLV